MPVYSITVKERLEKAWDGEIADKSFSELKTFAIDEYGEDEEAWKLAVGRLAELLTELDKMELKL